MAAYVDNVRIEWRGNRWCHLVADTLDELHQTAQRLGLRREWFQSNASYPHYDLTMQVRERAIRLGVQEGSRRQIIRCAKILKSEFLAQKENMSQLELFT